MVTIQKGILLLVLLAFSINIIFAQQKLTTKALTSSNTGTQTTYYVNNNEPPRAIEFKERTILTSNFLFNVNGYLGVSTEFTFLETESNTDKLGIHHRLLQQYYKGIPLEGMGYRVHEKNGYMKSANGREGSSF